MSSRAKRFFIWVACVMVFAYLPWWYALLYDWFHGSTKLVDEIIVKGDLVLIGCAVTADAFGRTILRFLHADERPSGFSISMLIFSLLAMAGCVLVYAASRPDSVLKGPMTTAAIVAVA